MAARRTLVSYDDISSPQDATPVQLGPPLPSTNQPPAKKRRTQQKAPPRRAAQQVQHWDDVGNAGGYTHYNTADTDENADGIMGENEEESRELTHEEIWDDSALIDAWNSATIEYEAYHGKTKKWKEEPIKKSPLWYNIPPDTSKTAKASSTHTDSLDPNDQNSKPLDFETYVPTHDPTLASGSEAPAAHTSSATYHQSYLPSPTIAGTMASQDEAFEKALNAMYWSGYWTAIYHYRRHGHTQNDRRVEDGGEAEGEEDSGEVLMEDDLIETQR